MFIFKMRKAIFLLLLLVSPMNPSTVDESNQFIKQTPFSVNLFKEKVDEFRIFEFSPSSFYIPLPPDLDKIGDNSTRYECQMIAEEMIIESNKRIDDEVESSCFSSDEKFHAKKKRFIVEGAIVVLVVGLISSAVINVKNWLELRDLRSEVEGLKENMEELKATLKSLNHASHKNIIINRIRIQIADYVQKAEAIVIKFIQKLHSKQPMKLQSLPQPIISHFNLTKNAQDQTFYFLKLHSCDSRKLVIQITAAHSELNQVMNCNNYFHLGFFENNVYHKPVFMNPFCKSEKNYLALNIQKCIKDYSKLNCTNTALTLSKCNPDDIRFCKHFSQITVPNYIHSMEVDGLIGIATKIKTYMVKHGKNGEKLIHTVPPSGIFVVRLNDEEMLLIGDVTYDGSSKKKTQIAHIIAPSKINVDPIKEFKEVDDQISKISFRQKAKNFFYEYDIEIYAFIVLSLSIGIIVCLICKYCNKRRYF